jgi:hypothetical protein
MITDADKRTIYFELIEADAAYYRDALEFLAPLVVKLGISLTPTQEELDDVLSRVRLEPKEQQ